MAGIGAITGVLGTSGSITAPSGTVALTAGSAMTPAIRDFGILDWTYLSNLRAILFGHGTTFQYHAIDTTLYLNGPLAPTTALTAAPTAVRASVVFTFSGANAAAARPTSGETIQVGKPGQVGNGFITFKTTLDPTLAVDQVLIGADIDACLTNVQAFVNNTGTNGVTYFIGRPGGTADQWSTANDITVSAKTAFAAGSATITFRAITYGLVGNTYVSVDATTTGAAASALFTGGAAGTGTAPGIGKYTYAYAWKRSADDALTAIGTVTQITQDTNSNVDLSALANPVSRDGTDYIEWFRSTAGGSVYYMGTDVATGGAGTVTDSLSDATIIGFGHVLTDAADQARNYRPRTAGYPTNVRAITQFKGVVFGTGAFIAATNSAVGVTVTNGSASVTASTQVTTQMIGRTFRLHSKTIDYVIVDVAETAGGGTLTLNRPYGETGTSAIGDVSDERDPFEVFYTTPLKPNNWPVGNSLKGITSPDPRGNTAIKTMQDGLAVFTHTGLWKVYGDPDSRFQVLPVSEGCGCFSPRAVADVDGTLYWLGRGGVKSWNGTGPVRDLSQVEDVQRVRGLYDTMARINLDAIDGVVAVYNPSDGYMKWYVPLDGEPYNNYCLTLNTTTESFSLDTTVGAVTAAGAVTGVDGKYHTLIGDAYGCTFECDVGTSDGAYGFETVNAISSYTAATRTITCSAAAFVTTGSGLAGVPFEMVDVAGSFFRGKVLSNTGTTLVLAWPLSQTPTSSDYVVAGAIHKWIRTNRFDDYFLEGRRVLSSVRVLYSPSTGGRMFCAAETDNGSPSVYLLRSTGVADYADLTNTDGEHLFVHLKGRGRRAVIELHDFVPGHDSTTIGFVPVIPIRDRVFE